MDEFNSSNYLIYFNDDYAPKKSAFNASGKNEF
jgi:hypothetical protein